LAWNVLCDGTFFEVRAYDGKARPVSLGTCGLTSGASKKTQCTVGSIGWTGLTCRLKLAGEDVSVRESLLTPALWFHTSGTSMSFFMPLPGRPVPSVEGLQILGVPRLNRPYTVTRNGRLHAPWFVAFVKCGEFEVPVLAILRRNPASVEWKAGSGLLVRWDAFGNDIGLLPLWGSRAAMPRTEAAGVSPTAIEKRASVLATRFLWLPIGLKETYSISAAGVAVTDKVAFQQSTDEWGWSRRTRGYAVVPPAVASAKRYGYPVAYDRRVDDLGYPTFTSSLCAAEDSKQITYTLPLPDLYGTIVAPVAAPDLQALMPPDVAETVKDYSQYVIDTYKANPGYIFDGSAIGEARALAAEYGGYRIMTPQAQSVFDDWADRAAADRIFNRDRFYGYGKDVASPRRFLIDNYRLGGNDYEDAGWFGYEIVTMWERAFFANRWKDIRDNWAWIREMFYGWNWVYTDYAVGYAPLYVDASNGGSTKGYTDNMAMLPALYAWARMADKVGDRDALADALYMLARDRVGRFSRMTVYDYSRKCGYDTRSIFTVSDQGNGPNLSPADSYIPTDTAAWRKGPVVDFGEHAQGLWFLTGSFLEPPSIETLDMILAGDMKSRVASTYELIDSRYPRWWAAPEVAETCNYQIYLRGALLHDDPARLRYYFEYQDGLGEGNWGTNAFHPYAFLGIALSPYRSLESRHFLQAKVRVRGFWQPVKDELQFDVVQGTDGKLHGAVWNGTGAMQTVRLSLDVPADAKPGSGFAIARSAWLLEPGRTTQMVLQPGITLITAIAPKGAEQPLDVTMPANVRLLSGRTAGIPILLKNGTRSRMKCVLEARGMVLVPKPGAGVRGFSSLAVVVAPMSELKVAARVAAPDVCVAPYDVAVTVRGAGREIRKRTHVLVLPATVALLSLDAESYARSPQLGSARVFATNRFDKPELLALSWTLGGLAKGAENLRLAAHASKEWEIPIRYKTTGPIRATLKCELNVPHMGAIVRQMRMRVLPEPGVLTSPESFTLYDFGEGDVEGWFMPAWAEGNQDDSGKVRRPYTVSGPTPSGGRAMESPIRIVAGRFSAAFFGVKVNGDWRSFDSLAVDVYLPADAPKGLEARWYLIGNDWKWREPSAMVALVPGSWCTLQIPLAELPGILAWKLPGATLSDVMSWVREFGVKICNADPGLVGYRGIVRLGDVRVETR
jgi:hypothetical protein